MQNVFGPVPSRRLGQSLGIDTILLKTCNWNCVYCQLGRTKPLTNERKEYFPPDEILIEVRQALDTHQLGEIDWVTFVGSGEPLLYSGMGYLIRQIKAFQHVQATGEVTPSGWEPGKATLKPGPDLVGKVWQVWKPEMAFN